MQHNRLLAAVALLAMTTITADTAEDNTHEPKVPIDGVLNDWAGVAPVWPDAGRAKANDMQVFDVKDVYLGNDDHNLYIFLRLNPSLSDWLRTKSETAAIGQFFFDTDSDATTGSQDISSVLSTYRPGIDAMTHVQKELCRGHEARMSVDIGVAINRAKAVSQVACRLDVFGADSGFDVATPAWFATSRENPDLIAVGTDGLELALPLKELSVDDGQRIRVMFVEDRGVGRAESCNWTTYELKKASPRGTKRPRIERPSQ